jgi:predicted transcriptional regulator
MWCLECGFARRRSAGICGSRTPPINRICWQLPVDFPLVVPAYSDRPYSDRRSAMAKALGLGAGGPRLRHRLRQAGSGARGGPSTT